MKKFIIISVFALSLPLISCGTDSAVEVSPDYILQPDEVLENHDLTADEYDETYDDPAFSSGLAVTGDGCERFKGTWILNTYTTKMTASVGAVTTVHNNSGKRMIMNDDCTYIEDYSTEYFVPARMVQSFTDRGMDISQISALLGGVAAEDIVCSYQGVNSGTFEVGPSGGFNTVMFAPDAVNRITGSCSPNVAGALQVSGTHFTPGIGNTAVKAYEYLFENGDDKMVLRSGFVSPTGTEINITAVYTRE